MKYLKGTLEKLEAYNEKVSIGENYHDTTSKWADVIEVEGGFYIAFNEKYPSDLEKIDNLPVGFNETNE
jgi:hypothetical protein